MKNLAFLLLCATLFSCNNEKKLEEVALPEPETEATVSNLSNPADVQVTEGEFKMKGLAYKYDALEPFIDGKTMEVHYSKHHLGYANKLNAAAKEAKIEGKTIEEVLANLDIKNMALRNNAGGYYNHNLFFEILSAKKDTKPTGAFAEAVTKDFGSFDQMKSQIIEMGTKLFGSGWVWIIVDKNGKLTLTQTANQDNPLMPNATEKGTPIFALDIWEHAYYLKHQNKRADYLESFFNVVNWETVSNKYDDLLIAK